MAVPLAVDSKGNQDYQESADQSVVEAFLAVETQISASQILHWRVGKGQKAIVSERQQHQVD